MFSIIIPPAPPFPPAQPIPGTTDKFAFSFPFTPQLSHIVVFLVPGHTLPPGTAAAVYLQLPHQQGGTFLGGLGTGKESAVYKVNPGSAAQGEVNVGISIESEESVRGQMEMLESQKRKSQSHSSPTLHSLSTGQPSTKVLAQRIIQNAFNFLASFSGRVGGDGVEVVPLKSFEEWWRKFERKVEMDPSFLERAQE
jgi:protein Hikeshi